MGRIRTYAQENGMYPVSHLVDKHGSREEFDWMMAQAASDNPPFRTILIHSLDRLTRSAAELRVLLDELVANGLEFLSVRDGQAK